MKLLLDMNISPDWCELFSSEGHEAVHWGTIGNPGSNSPSVIQIRIQDVHPYTAGNFVIENLRRFAQELETGALISIDRDRSRARILPIS